jgi:hypothetical protein
MDFGLFSEYDDGEWRIHKLMADESSIGYEQQQEILLYLPTNENESMVDYQESPATSTSEFSSDNSTLFEFDEVQSRDKEWSSAGVDSFLDQQNEEIEIRNRSVSCTSVEDVVNGFDWSFVSDSSRRDKIKRWKNKKHLIQTGQVHSISYDNIRKAALERHRVRGRFLSSAESNSLTLSNSPK